MVYTLGRVMFSLALFFVLVFFSPFILSIVITSLGEERAGLRVSRASVCSFCACSILSFFLFRLVSRVDCDL